MDYIYIGKIVNTHGIKGEVRILSDFKYKDKAFVKDFTLYIGKDKTPLVIDTYRYHKIYDMVTFTTIHDINDVLQYKGDNVYINKEDIKECGFLNEDIIGCNVYSKDKLIGIVDSILKTKAHEILVVKNEDKTSMVPFIDEFIEDVNVDTKSIYIKEIEGLINEN